MASRPAIRRRIAVGAFAAIAGGLSALPAQASEPLSDKGVANARLAVNAKGEALITYRRAGGQPRRVLVWGAVNALPPNPAVRQAHFRYDYAGGRGKYRKLYWKTFRNACRPYDGPELAGLVAACKAPDGSYWALQSWQRNLPLLGFTPWTSAQSAYELHVSHWTGPLADLTVALHWTYGATAFGLFGKVTYKGRPVHGFHTTPSGNPHERYSRNVYIDTRNSVYGPGWARESGILLHTPNGTFCHSFVPQKPSSGYPSADMRPAASGDRYRVQLSGPGVTPMIRWEGVGISSWTGSSEQRATQARADLLWSQFMAGDAQCAPEHAS